MNQRQSEEMIRFALVPLSGSTSHFIILCTPQNLINQLREI